MRLKLEALGLALLFSLGIFMLGTYACSVRYDIQPVEDYRWVITSLVTLAVGVLTYDKIREIEKND